MELKTTLLKRIAYNYCNFLSLSEGWNRCILCQGIFDLWQGLIQKIWPVNLNERSFFNVKMKAWSLKGSLSGKIRNSDESNKLIHNISRNNFSWQHRYFRCVNTYFCKIWWMAFLKRNCKLLEIVLIDYRNRSPHPKSSRIAARWHRYKQTKQQRPALSQFLPSSG